MATIPVIVSLPDVSDGTVYDVQLQRTLVKLFRENREAINALYVVAAALGSDLTYAGAAPTTGTHSPPEILFNNGPTELGTAGAKYVILGWVCTLAGTPGTWLECRVLTGN